MDKRNLFKLFAAIIVSELAGIIGSFFTTPSIPGWYSALIKPAFNPPSWVFAPVWTALFALMGVSAFLIWREGFEKKKVKVAFGIFLGQLILNTFWSIIFFGLHNPGWALVEIVVLWLAILATIIAFAKISKPAAWLLVPYIVWVSFAGFLNYSIWQLNSGNDVYKQNITEEKNMENKLQITDEIIGTGEEAKKGDTVTVNYLGTLLDGSKFDSSYDRGVPFSFHLGAGEVIKGWDEGVAGMRVGGKRKLVIPPDLAYGNRSVGNGLIPANSTLVFEIELLKVE